MQKFYTEFRKPVAIFLLLTVVGLNLPLFLVTDVRARVLALVASVSLLAAICLAVTVFSSKTRLKVDGMAFWLASIAIGMIWQANAMHIPVVIWLAVVALAVVTAAIAVVLNIQANEPSNEAKA